MQSVTSLAGPLILDIGSSPTYRFPLATRTVGWEGEIRIDLSCKRLPFDTQEADFVFCRHTLEDMADPTHLLREIKRVAKAGYIEIPSPIAEVTRGVDAIGGHRGYYHHRWLGLGSGSSLILCAKYPVIERQQLKDYRDVLQVGPWGWNTHCLFDEKSPLTFKVWQHGSGLDLSQFDRDGYQWSYRDSVQRLCDLYMREL